MYTQEVVKSMLGLFDKVNQKIDKHDAEMEIKNQQIQYLEDKVTNLQTENSIHKIKVDSMAADLEEVKKKMMSIAQQNLCEKENVRVEELKQQINSDAQKMIQYEKNIQSKDERILRLETEIKNLLDKAKQAEALTQQKIELLQTSNEQQIHEIAQLNATLSANADKASKCEMKIIEQKRSVKSCGATGAYEVKIFNDSPFEVLCNSDVAGPGWTVIQQRIKGGVDFFRNWTTYRDGFGDFWDGDFFLGLEKVHTLTSEQPHELFIYMQGFDGTSYYARYDEFAISGEDDHYTIKKLGAFSGNVKDEFAFARDMSFSTYDRDNDLSRSENCAVYYHNGWWNSDCFDRYVFFI